MEVRNRWWVIVYFLLVREFLQSLHMWPWDSGAFERRARRTKKRASSSWLFEVVDDGAETWGLLRSSYRNSWHVTLREYVSNTRFAWAEGSYVGHIFQSKRTLLHSLGSIKRARPIIWSTTNDKTVQACISKLFA